MWEYINYNKATLLYQRANSNVASERCLFLFCSTLTPSVNGPDPFGRLCKWGPWPGPRDPASFLGSELCVRQPGNGLLPLRAFETCSAVPAGPSSSCPVLPLVSWPQCALPGWSEALLNRDRRSLCGWGCRSHWARGPGFCFSLWACATAKDSRVCTCRDDALKSSGKGPAGKHVAVRLCCKILNGNLNMSGR